MTEEQIKTNIIKRVSKIPLEKLKELELFVSKLEKSNQNKSNILSFAGSWGDIDNDVFNDLTANLIKNRQKNRNRIHE